MRSNAIGDVQVAQDPTPATTTPIPTATTTVLEGQGLSFSYAGVKTIFKDINLFTNKDEFIAIVGPTGTGKSTLLRVLARLITPSSGKVFLDGAEVTRPTPKISLVHQSIATFPWMTALDNVRLVLTGSGMEEAESLRISKKMLNAVGLQGFESYYPKEMSGGMRQRVAIARALILKPKLIVLDEPVSALDMSVRAQVLNLLQDIQASFDLTYLFIAHDLSVVRYMCHNIAVMYLGRIVEICETQELFENPLHPYTKALLDAVPIPDPTKIRERVPLSGSIPSPMNLPTGCRFHTRCPYVMDVCSTVDPVLQEVSKGHFVACHLYDAKR